MVAEPEKPTPLLGVGGGSLFVDAIGLVLGPHHKDLRGS